MLIDRGIKTPNTHLWWDLHLPHKIKKFMWLLSKNKILTKENLLARQWQGDPVCILCNTNVGESTDHLFLKCPYVRHIQFWMGKAQHLFSHWSSIKNILNFEKGVRAETNDYNTESYQYQEMDKQGNIVYEETRQGSVWTDSLSR